MRPRSSWTPPDDWQRLETIELHTAGEPLRVFTKGLPPIEGDTILEKRRYFRDHCDHIRTGAILEPRGHADMYGAILTDPVTTDGDLGVIFLHNEGYSTMCGHAVIALGKLLAETGVIEAGREDAAFLLDTPAGQVEVWVRRGKDGDLATSFRNVPSFVLMSERSVSVSSLGEIEFDVAFGGAFYAFVRAEALGLALDDSEYARIIDLGRGITEAVAESFPIEHPFEEDLSFLYGTIFVGEPRDARHHSRNVCVFGDGEVDRSPTGTGVSARAAIHHARGELKPGEKIVVESILGTTMEVSVADRVKFGPYEAVVPEVAGTAYLTGRNELWFDPADPLAKGFLLR